MKAISSGLLYNPIKDGVQTGEPARAFPALIVGFKSYLYIYGRPQLRSNSKNFFEILRLLQDNEGVELSVIARHHPDAAMHHTAP